MQEGDICDLLLNVIEALKSPLVEGIPQTSKQDAVSDMCTEYRQGLLHILQACSKRLEDRTLV